MTFIMNPQLLILDLDETLVYSTDVNTPPRFDFMVDRFAVIKRPHVDLFLQTVIQWFDVAVWTSSSGSYGVPLVSKLFPSPEKLKFVWCSDRCTRRYNMEFQEYYWLKNLRKVKKLGYPLEKILMIDDSREKLEKHYGNHVRVTPFEGDSADTELRDLLPLLDYMRSVPNVRTLEKRGWQSKRWEWATER